MSQTLLDWWQSGLCSTWGNQCVWAGCGSNKYLNCPGQAWGHKHYHNISEYFSTQNLSSGKKK